MPTEVWAIVIPAALVIGGAAMGWAFSIHGKVSAMHPKLDRVVTDVSALCDADRSRPCEAHALRLAAIEDRMDRIETGG